MNCPNCNKTISQNDNFCRYCGKPVVVSSPIPPTFYSRRTGIKFPIELNDFGPAEILASHTGATWGAHIYTGHSQESHEIQARPEGCPEWVAHPDWRCWLRRGLTVWDQGAQCIGSLLAAEALELLKHLESNAEWKEHGIPIIERHKNEFSIGETPPPKRSRKKQPAEPEPPAEEPPPTLKFYEQERVRLHSTAAEEFFLYLRDQAPLLQRMADQETALQQKVDDFLFPIQMRFIRQGELAKFDGTNRDFVWERQDYPLQLVCNVPPDRGTITLSEDRVWWIPIIGRPDT